MPNRREFLQIGVTATAWPLAAGAARAAAAALPERIPIYTVVFDRRHRASVEFAARASTLGFATTAIEGDMTRIWFDDIDHQWRRHPIAIAGLTEHGPLFCFEQLGRDHGLRIVFRGEHGVDTEREPVHIVVGPERMLEVCARLDVAGGSWPALVADAIASCPSGRSEIRTATISGSAPAGTTDASHERLYSWVLAPAVRTTDAAA